MEQEIFRRTQFTFYESFYNSIEKTLRKKSEKLIAYEALIQYALYGTIEEKENIPPAVSGLLEAFYPFLNTARRKAKTYKQAADRGEFAAKDSNKNKIENKIEIKNEIKNEKEIENKGIPKMFEQFWGAYPKKVGREEAYRVFCEQKVPLSTLLPALEQQKVSPQWLKEGGRYIPNPATWLKDRRWQSDINTPYRLGTYEIEAINRILKNPSTPT